MSTFNELIDFTRSTTGTYLDSVVYGPELVTNGDFVTDSDWIKDSGWTISNGQAQCDGTDGAQFRTIDSPLTNGKTYYISYQITAYTSGDIRVLGQSFYGISSNSVSTVTGIFVATKPYLRFYSSAFNGSIDNVSVKEVIGGQVSGTPLLRTAAINEPRLEYDANGNPLGLLIEEARTNLVTQSEFASGFFNLLVTLTLNQATSPDTNINAASIVPSAANGEHYLESILSSPSSGTYTQSVFVKANGYSKVALTPVHVGADQGATSTARFDLTEGTSTQTGSTVPYISNLGNGWYRIGITYTTTGIVTSHRFRVQVLSDSYEYVWQANGADGIYVYGAQLETGSFPTSYIPTSGSAVTRAADVASLPVERFAYNQPQGSLFVYATAPDGLNQNRLTQLVTNGGSLNRVVDLHRVINNISMYNGTSTLIGSTFDASNNIKAAGVYKSGSYALVSDGGSTVTNSDTTVNTPDALIIGANGSSARQLNGHIKHIQYYPKRLSNEELELLTQPSASPTMNLTFDGQATSTLVEGLHD